MDGLTFKTLQESLGLSLDDVAEATGHNKRTIERWGAMRPEGTPSGKAIRYLEAIEQYVNDELSAFEQALDAVPAAEELVLYRYFIPKGTFPASNAMLENPEGRPLYVPLATFNILMMTKLVAARARGRDVRIEWAD